MRIQSEAIDQLFAPIVGTPAHTTAFADRLRGDVHAACSLDSSIDPYESLKVSGENALLAACDRLPEEVGKSLFTEGRIGLTMTVSTLKALGSIYMNEVVVPQQLPGVRRNVSVVLGHVYGVACRDRRVGRINKWAAHKALDPHSKRLRFSLFIGPFFPSDRLMTVDEVHPETFQAKLNDGQLSVEPRYSLMRKKGDGQCPATFAKVPGHEGRPRSALMVFVKAIGGVVIKDLYAKQFAIINDNTAPR